MLIAIDKASPTNAISKESATQLDIFGVVATLGVAVRSGSDGPRPPYDMHGATQWQRSRFA